MLIALLAAASPFILNLATEATKYLTGFNSTAGKRFILAVLAILGAIVYSAASGTPLQVDSISSLLQTALEAALAFFAAHGTYSLITGKTTAPAVPNA